jgi:zeaxanthin glucosyltransferase
MGTIAVCMFFEPGHILPTLRLAHGLRAAGHRVVYMTIPDYQGGLQAQGFETEVLLANQFPAGAITLRRSFEELERTCPGRSFVQGLLAEK